MNAAAAPQEQPHPSPQRARVGNFAEWFGLTGAPLAWALQLLIASTLLSYACYPLDEPLIAPVWSSAHAVALWVSAAAVVICLASGAVAWRNWRRTRGEKPGSANVLIAGGEGRSRFMAMSGMLYSGLFLIAVLLCTVMFTLLPLCGR